MLFFDLIGWVFFDFNCILLYGFVWCFFDMVSVCCYGVNMSIYYYIELVMDNRSLLMWL